LILDANVLILGQATYGVEPKEGLLVSGIGKDQNQVKTDAKSRKHKGLNKMILELSRRR